MDSKIRVWRRPQGLAILALAATVLPILPGGQAEAQTIVSIPEIQGAAHIYRRMSDRRSRRPAW